MKIKIDFQDFWNAYGMKRDRIAAERAWNQLPAKDKRAALAGIPTYREDCQHRGIAMMYAQGYLKHRRWEDEPTAAAPQTWNKKTVASPTRPHNDTLFTPTADELNDMDDW